MGEAPSNRRQTDFAETVAEVINPAGKGLFVLICEHASNHIPACFNNLGMDPSLRDSHIAWDPGALGVASELSRSLDAPLVASRVSRLVYDCNRAPSARDAIPSRSEHYDIPANRNLSDEERETRARTYYHPFQKLLDQTIEKSPAGAALVTIHSFTPIYFNKRRNVEIGLLHDRDSRLADLMLDSAANFSNYDVRRNEPYAPADGVMHTLNFHGVEKGLMNLMIEIRNDLIAAPEEQEKMAAMMASWLVSVQSKLTAPVGTPT